MLEGACGVPLLWLGGSGGVAVPEGCRENRRVFRGEGMVMEAQLP